MKLKLYMAKNTTIFLFLMIFACACSSQSEVIDDELNPDETANIVLNGETRAAADNLHKFYIKYTLDAIKYVDSNNEILSKNTIVSPLSTSMVLAMLANGVDNDAKSEILDYLGVKNLNSLNNLSEILLSELPVADKRAEMKIANAIWVNNHYKLNQDYTSLINLSYQGEINNADFGNGKKVADAINKWCSVKTDGLIRKMFDTVDPSSMVILLNAVFFKGKWRDETFLKENTKKETFNGLNKTTEVDMMHATHAMRNYFADDSFEIFYLPFGNRSFSFIGIVPREGISLEEATRLLTDEEIASLKENTVYCMLAVDMPKFKVENELKLNDIFKTGGLESVCESIDMKMFQEEVAGSIFFKQAANLEIDESGAKLAAVTSGDISTAAPIIPGSEQHVRLDRPFYFFIQENSTGACLLSGMITDI